MAQKHVLVTITHAPFGTIFYTEGLRAVVGATAGADEHTVDVVYLGDGVYFALKEVDRSDSAQYISALSGAGYRLKAERESLKARGISKRALAEDIEVISRRKLLALLNKADHTIDF